MEGTYGPNASVISKAEQRKRIEIVQIVLYAFLVFALSIIKTSNLVVYSLAMDFGTSPDKIRTICTVLLVASLVFLVLSIILTVIASKELNRLRASYIRLEETGISGTTFPESKSEPITQFSVEYSDIKSVVFCHTGVINILIYTQYGVFRCLEIESAHKIVEWINDKIKR